MLRWFRRTTPWQESHVVDLRHTLAVEATLANVRLASVAVSLAAAGTEYWRPYWTATSLLLVAYLLYSIAAAVAVRLRLVTATRHIVALHLVDTGGILMAVFLTGGAMSPLSTMYLFVLLAAGYRWGQAETLTTAAAGIAVFWAHAAFAGSVGWESHDPHLVLLRIAYLGFGGALIGYMAEAERVRRFQAWSVSRILSRVRSEVGLVAAVQAVLDELMSQFHATHAVLVLEEEGSDRVSVWRADADSTGRTVVRLREGRVEAALDYLFPIPSNLEAFELRRTSGGDESVTTALDPSGARIPWRPAMPLLAATFEWRSLFCLATMAGEGWKGRVFLFLPVLPAMPREQLRCLQTVGRQVGPALFNLFLQRRLQSRTGVVERARISRELHDGVIQSLIGVEMQLEVIRRESAGRVPEAHSTQLARIQHVLSQEILNVRDLMQLLKPVEVDPKRLVEHLADTVERFRHRTGIQASLACNADEIDLTPRVCREISGIVVEALANVRKHSSASSVVVRLGPSGADWQLVVDDNGQGLDFEGCLTHEEIEARRKGPQAIKERVRSIGGRLTLRSQPGFGTCLEITIPGRHRG